MKISHYYTCITCEGTQAWKNSSLKLKLSSIWFFLKKLSSEHIHIWMCLGTLSVCTCQKTFCIPLGKYVEVTAL